MIIVIFLSPYLHLCPLVSVIIISQAQCVACRLTADAPMELRAVSWLRNLLTASPPPPTEKRNPRIHH